jgi:hypothetical protein
LENPYSECINIDNLKHAIKWCEIFESHLPRVYQLHQSSDEHRAILILNKIQQPNTPINNPFKIRDIKQKGWSGLIDTGQIKKAINILIDLGYVYQEPQESQKVGRKSETYGYHPDLNKTIS